MKTKLNVIRPTLRHKKRYVLLEFLEKKELDAKSIHSSLVLNLQKAHGIFTQIETNITVLDFDKKTKTLLIRVNKEYLDEFINSLFFSQTELGLLKILKITSTIKKINGDKL